MKKELLLISILLYPLFLIAQQEFATGQWSTHSRFHHIRKISFLEQNVVAISGEGIMIYDQKQNEFITLAKENGLGAIDATALVVSKEDHLFITGYASGEIDIFQENEIVNIKTLSSLAQFKEKKINNLVIKNGKVYAATELGVFVINIVNKTPSDLYREIGPNGTPVSVLDLAIVGDTIYALTEGGILAGNTTQNLLDYAQWNSINIPNDFPSNHDMLFAYSDQLIFTSRNTVYARDQTNEAWQQVIQIGEDILDLHIEEKSILLLGSNFLWSYENGHLDSLKWQDGLAPQNFAINEDGKIWVGDSLLGLIAWEKTGFKNFLPNSPPIGEYSFLESFENQTFILTNQKGCYYFEDNYWYNVNSLDTLKIGSLALHKGNLYAAPSTGGVLIINGIEIRMADISKEVVVNSISSWGDIVVGTSLDADYAFFRLSPHINLTQKMEGWAIQKILDISYGGNVWLQVAKEEGGKALSFEITTEKLKRLTGGGELTSNQWHAVSHSRDDEAWIATSNGLGIYTSGTEPQDPPFLPSLGGNVVFEDIDVHDLVFDGGNRCWVATNSGLWLLDDQFSSIIDIYTADNSPLPSSNLNRLSLTYSGLLFIETDLGLVSLQTASSRAKSSHFQVKIFPQPVSLGRNQLVTITGVVDSGQIKITTLAGNLVKEIQAIGSTANWDLTTFGGQKVAPGIYLLLSSDFSGEETFIGKVAVTP